MDIVSIFRVFYGVIVFLLLIKAELKGTPADNNKNIRFCLLTFKWPHRREGLIKALHFRRFQH